MVALVKQRKLLYVGAIIRTHGPSDVHKSSQHHHSLRRSTLRKCKYWWMRLEVACLSGIAIAPIEAPKNGWSKKIVTTMLSDVVSSLQSRL